MENPKPILVVFLMLGLALTLSACQLYVEPVQASVRSQATPQIDMQTATSQPEQGQAQSATGVYQFDDISQVLKTDPIRELDFKAVIPPEEDFQCTHHPGAGKLVCTCFPCTAGDAILCLVVSSIEQCSCTLGSDFGIIECSAGD